MNRTESTVCECGKSKAPRARVCFDCLHAEHVANPKWFSGVTEYIGGCGPRFYAYRQDGSVRRFSNYQEALTWTK